MRRARLTPRRHDSAAAISWIDSSLGDSVNARRRRRIPRRGCRTARGRCVWSLSERAGIDPSHDFADSCVKVVIVAENASTGFGGEAILPWHYFACCSGAASTFIWWCTSERERSSKLLPEAPSACTSCPTWRFKVALPDERQFAARAFREHARHRHPCRYLSFSASSCASWCDPRDSGGARADAGVAQAAVVHARLGAPVVIGPMNGGMDFPLDFAEQERARARRVGEDAALALRESLIPGKRRAAALLVANERTRPALPRSAPAR